MNGKKGLVAILVTLIAVIALASAAYGILAPKMQSETQNTASSSAETSGTDSTSGSGTTDATRDSSSSASNSNNQAISDTDTPNDMDQSASNLEFPAFTVADIDGQEVSLENILNEGKPVFLGFWATWCPPCMQEAPDIQKLYERYGDQVNFVMVNATDGSRDTVETVTEWYNAQDYTYPIYLDTKGEAAQAGGVMYLPTLYTLDTNGNVVHGESGAITEEYGSQLIEELLNL